VLHCRAAVVVHLKRAAAAYREYQRERQARSMKINKGGPGCGDVLPPTAVVERAK
jgi:hypothetical protein